MISGNAGGNVLGAARIQPPAARASRQAARGCRPISIRRASPPGRSAAMSAASSGCASIGGRNTGCVRRIGARRAALQPGEQRHVGRREAVPDLLHRVGIDAADLGQRDLRQPRRGADAQPAGDQLQQREPHRRRRRHPASRRPGRAARLSARSPAPRPRPRDAAAAALVGAAGHISATVSARSPT